jgi:mono/diheme cytochrome c family protein
MGTFSRAAVRRLDWAVAAVALAIAAPADAETGDVHGGQQLMLEACVQCHGLRPVRLTRDGVGGWQETVERMVVFGAQLDPAEVETLVSYLAIDYGPGKAPMTTGPLPPGAVGVEVSGESPGEPQLPAGEGRDLVAALCTTCHDAGRLLATRRSDASWSRYVREMLAQGKIDPAPEQFEAMVAYLQANFGSGR